MFETAELDRKISNKEYRERLPSLREALLHAQSDLGDADFPVIVLIAGVDGAGKRRTTNLLSEWLDPHFIVTRAFEEPTQDERQRPGFWRYWLSLPPRGHMGVFLSAWYSKPLLEHVYGKVDTATFDARLDKIVSFERTLVDDGALVLKFWMHLGREQQRRYFLSLEDDPLQRWRVNEKRWEHWRMYDQFVATAEHLIMRTSTGDAPWHIVEGADVNYASLKVGSLLLEALRRHLKEHQARARREAELDVAVPEERVEPELEPLALEVVSSDGGQNPLTVLSQLDMSVRVGKAEYRERLEALQARLNGLQRKARRQGVSTILVFEGWDAAGKGGAIRRVTGALDARDYEVKLISPPTDEELDHHYLWRFWRHLPRDGRFLIFDRSWYGRVLVERVEGFASEKEWRRAYAEINDFEQELVDHGIVLVKFWVHITLDEQEERFELRQETPYKRWKLTEEDLRNRSRWSDYEIAVNDMVERTSTGIAPWILVEGNDKRYARIKVLESVCCHLERSLADEEGADPTLESGHV
jgi:polyphosphate:AMP phosphotransferase